MTSVNCDPRILERLNEMKKDRSEMLCKLTQKKGEMLQLMGSVCNVEQVKDEMKYGFEQMCKDIE